MNLGGYNVLWAVVGLLLIIVLLKYLGVIG